MSFQNPPPKPIVKDEDYRLLTRLKNGDPDAFQQIFYRWEKPLFNFLYKLTGSRQDAEDISQETYIRIWETASAIDPAKGIRSYIFLIARQSAWKHRRRTTRDALIVSDQQPTVADNIVADDSVVVRETEMLVNYSIGKLPRKTKEVYMLYYNDGLSNEQISQKLNMTTDSVKSHLWQARRRLREMLLLMASFLFLFYKSIF